MSEVKSHESREDHGHCDKSNEDNMPFDKSIFQASVHEVNSAVGRQLTLAHHVEGRRMKQLLHQNYQNPPALQFQPLS